MTQEARFKVMLKRPELKPALAPTPSPFMAMVFNHDLENVGVLPRTRSILSAWYFA